MPPPPPIPVPYSSGQEVNWRWMTVRLRLWSRYWSVIILSTWVGATFRLVRMRVMGPCTTGWPRSGGKYRSTFCCGEGRERAVRSWRWQPP